MNIHLDPWQEEVLATKGNICLCSGRQVGKSTVISIDAAEYAVKNKQVNILIISAVERQAQALFQKVLWYMQDKYPKYISKGKNRPTQSLMKLGNGSTIRCLPTGIDGHGIRGFTVHRLYADEAAFISELVWDAITPMLLTTGGDIILLSTPHGNSGYFARAFKDKDFTQFHVSSVDVIKDRVIGDHWTEYQRRKGIQYLEREKANMTELQFAQEYLGQFVDKLMRFFPTQLIKQITVMTKRGSQTAIPNSRNYLGVDIARMGRDETVLASMAFVDKNNLIQNGLEITTKTKLTDTVRLILSEDLKYDYSKIYIDDGGLGVGVFDPLLEHEQTKRKVIGINNAQRAIVRDGKRNKKLIKEDLYFNLKNLMEKNKIKLFDDPETAQSLASVQYEYTSEGNIRIYGKYTHIVEALIRAAWCVRDKKLNIYIG